MTPTAANVGRLMLTLASDPNEYNVAATERVVDILSPYIVRQRRIKTAFHTTNRVKWIDFADENQRKFYQTYYQRYLDSVNGGDNPLVALNKFSQAAEIVRHEQIADEAIAAHRAGKAVLICAKYKDTLVQVMTTLHSKYHIPLDRVSTIWGGINKQQLELLERRKAMREQLNEEQLLLMEELNITEIAATSFCPITDASSELRARFFRLQDQVERQANIDAFQNEATDFCCYTAAAGGVALSLHAHAEWSRPREVILTPCWSDHQMVQCVGRGHRVTSTSDTTQTMMLFKGTVEVHIAHTFRKKMKGLLKVVGGRESWLTLAQDQYGNNELELESGFTGEIASD